MSINEFIDRVAKAHHKQPESRCPTCQERLTCNASVSDTAAPVPESFSLCAYCGTVLQFQPDLSLAVAPESELAEFKAEDPKNYDQLLYLQRVAQIEAGRRRRRKARFS